MMPLVHVFCWLKFYGKSKNESLAPRTALDRFTEGFIMLKVAVNVETDWGKDTN